MPRCEGRPERSCPFNKNDRTVRNSQGDLMLCGECERYRFPYVSSASSLSSSSAGGARVTRSDKSGICSNRSLCNPQNSTIVLQPYEVERLLSKMKASSPGLDNIPHWFFRACSYEIADTVADILNLSFASGTVPKQWLSAVVTPVPKVAKPETLSDYRPISVTPLLSRLAEKLVASRWLLPAIPSCTLDDQFGFRPTGSTTCALILSLIHI